MRRKLLAVVLTVMVIASSLPLGIGIAGAADDVHRYEYTGGIQTAHLDVSNATSEIQVEITTDEGPQSGTTVLVRETYNAPNIDNGNLLFHNEGAYESFNVTITGTTEDVGFKQGDTWTGKAIGSTGGDSDLTCDFKEKLAGHIRPTVPQLDCTAQPEALDVDTSDSDAEQIKIDMYQSAQNQLAAEEGHLDSIDNNLQDAKTTALIKGKNAAIRELNNGSSESAAKTAAQQAVADYYAVIEENVVRLYERKVLNQEYLHETAENESGISASTQGLANNTYFRQAGTHADGSDTVEWRGPTNATYNTVDGRSIDYQAPIIYVDDSNEASYEDTITVTQSGKITGEGSSSNIESYGWVAAAPNSNYDPLRIFDWEAGVYASRLDTIQAQNADAQSQVGTVVNQTYDAYTDGDINNSDLVDPYVLSSEYSPGTQFESWAAAQLTLIGQNSPEAFDQIGHFNVTTEDGTDYEGVLFSAENPPSGQFEVNETYNPADIGGTQYITTDQQIRELTTNFTINRIVTSSGETQQNVTIVEKTYTTSNATELKELYDQLNELRAEIEARESALGGGGGGLSQASNYVLVGLAAAVVVLWTRDGS